MLFILFLDLLLKKKNIMNVKIINELIILLDHDNLIISDKPIFHWNGNTVTDDETAQIKQVATYKLPNGGLIEFLSKNKNNKVVICPFPEGMIINDDNYIRVYINEKEKKPIKKLNKHNILKELLNNLGYSNVRITELPIFLWDGDDIVHDTIEIKDGELYDGENIKAQHVTAYKLPSGGLIEFLEKNKDNKVVLYPHTETDTIVAKFGDVDGIIRAFIDEKNNV